MVRYCTCNRDTGYSNHTSVVRDSLGDEICAHCGGVVPPEGPYTYDPYRYPDGVESENDDYESMESSRKRKHLAAIEYYKKLIRQPDPGTKFEEMSLIAGEYEAVEDYALAEEYLNLCTAVENPDSYKYLALKGDFLFRMERHGEAVEAYEKGLKILEELDDKNFSSSHLKYYARITHFIISSYYRLGRNDHEEKYRSGLKRAIDRFRRSGGAKDGESDARLISEIACEIYDEDGMYDEALILIDSAIEIHPDEEYYWRKAIFIKYKLKIDVIVKRVKPHGLGMINEALRILPDDADRSPYLKVKSDILNLLGDFVNAKICNALAYEHYDEVETAEKQLKKLKKPGTYINIAGTPYYKGFVPFSEGVVVDLVRESDNPHDEDAICVEIDGETVGYVANSKYTLIKEVKSATDIKDFNSTQAIVQFILFNEWVIAKLI